MISQGSRKLLPVRNPGKSKPVGKINVTTDEI